MKYFIYITVIGAILTLASLIIGEANKKNRAFIFTLSVFLLIAGAYFSFKYEKSKEIDTVQQNKKLDSALVNTEKLKKTSSEIISNIERSLEDVSHLNSTIDSLNKKLISFDSDLKPQIKTEIIRDKKENLTANSNDDEKIKTSTIKRLETNEETLSTKKRNINNEKVSVNSSKNIVKNLGTICILNTNFYFRRVVLTNKKSGKKETIIIGPAGAANKGKSVNSCIYDLSQGVYSLEVFTTFSKKLIEKYEIKIIANQETSKTLNQNHYN